ncbi:MAG TPA: CopD family protein [Streptosporangiaceae bacterium]|nr:CopD family protein [Streptosporangiaceae bacterium]
MSVALSVPGLWLTGAERGLLLAGLAVALGGLAGRGLARHYKGSAPAPLPEPWALYGSLLGLAASAALIVTAIAGPGLAADLAHPRVLGLGSLATVIIAEVQFVCFAVATLLIRRYQSRGLLLPLLGVVLAEAVRAHPDGMIPAAGALLTICHLLPAVLWAGMLVYVLQAARAWRGDPAAVRGLIRLYSNAVAWLFAVVVVTGLVSAVLLVPLGSLLTTPYGRFLIVKAALVAVAATLAVAGRVSLGRAAAGPARATTWERAVLAVVLVVTGVLTVITPPSKPIYSNGTGPVARAGRVTRAGQVTGARQPGAVAGTARSGPGLRTRG